jgi:outer membrane beta-barrel protein
VTKLIGLSTILATICLAPFAYGDAYDLPKVVAVQDRAYIVHKEVSVNFGGLPLDAFNKSIIGGISYTYGLNSKWNWEVFNVAGAMNVETQLKSDLLNNFNAEPKGVLDHPQAIYTSELLYSPMYGKFLMFNNRVVHNEISLGITGGALDYKEAGMVGIVGPGLTSRFFVSQDSSIKFDARLLYQFTQSQSSNVVLYLTIGYSFHLDTKAGDGT